MEHWLTSAFFTMSLQSTELCRAPRLPAATPAFLARLAAFCKRALEAGERMREQVGWVWAQGPSFVAALLGVAGCPLLPPASALFVDAAGSRLARRRSRAPS